MWVGGGGWVDVEAGMAIGWLGGVVKLLAMCVCVWAGIGGVHPAMS